MSVHGHGLNGAIQYLASHESPHLLILEIDLSEDALLDGLERLAAVVSPETRVMIIGNSNDIGLYRRLIGMGISEYLFGPLDPGDVVSVITRIFAGSEDQHKGRVIGVYGSRGGVGTSAVAANVAFALAKSYNEPVVLVDLDIAFGTASLALNVNARQTVADVLVQPDRLDEVLVERSLIKINDKISLLAAPSQPNAQTHIDGRIIEALINILQKTAAYVVLDIPHLWAPWVRELLIECNELVLVTYPDLANLRDVRNLVEVLNQARGTGAPTQLILNRVGVARKGELTGKDFEESVKLTPKLSIPYEPGVFGTAMNNGDAVVQTAPNSESTKSFLKLATLVSGKGAAKKARKGGGIFSKLLKR